jgi:hypothetical protein
MRSLQVEFAPRGVALRRLGWAAAALLWSVAGVMAWQAFHARQAVREVERERDQLRAELSALQASAARLAQPKPAPPYLRDAQQLVQMAQFDSAGVLRAIETVRVPGVRVTALELSAVDATARLELEVSVPDALLRYVGELNAGEPTPRWVIVRSQAAGPGGMMSASLEARWAR